MGCEKSGRRVAFEVQTSKEKGEVAGGDEGLQVEGNQKEETTQ